MFFSDIRTGRIVLDDVDGTRGYPILYKALAKEKRSIKAFFLTGDKTTSLHSFIAMKQDEIEALLSSSKGKIPYRFLRYDADEYGKLIEEKKC
jgi:hypothetical protein